jgi:hypothetical protein
VQPPSAELQLAAGDELVLLVATDGEARLRAQLVAGKRV